MAGKFCFVLFRLLTITVLGLAFTPDPLRLLFLSSKPEDATHTTLTEAGIKRAIRQYFLEKSPNAQAPPASSSKNSSGYDWVLNLVGLNNDDGVVEIFQHRYGPDCALDLVSYHSAVQEIVLANGNTDSDPVMKNQADFHFDGEKFDESNANVISMRNKTKSALAAGQLHDARVAFGHALHIIQDFYSHSNWVELNKTEPNPGLGTDTGFGLPVAGPEAPTCKSCPDGGGECNDNMVVTDQLTSGYFRGNMPGDKVETDKDGKLVVKPTEVDKCSHGGPLDESAKTNPSGGINKDTSDPMSSPHASLHHKAANLAEQATADFITAFRREIGDEQFEKFLELSQPQCQSSRRRRSAYFEPVPVQKIMLFTVAEKSHRLPHLVHDQSRHPVLISSAVTDITKTPLLIPIDSMLENFAVKIYTVAPRSPKIIVVTTPSNVSQTFKATLQNGSATYIHVQAPEPGVWKIEVTKKAAPCSVNVLGVSTWDAIINVMAKEDRMRHAQGPTLRLIQTDESLLPGTILYVHVMTPAGRANVRNLELRGVDGGLVKKVPATGNIEVKDGFARQLFQVIAPKEQFRFVVRAKDGKGFDVLRASETVYSPKIDAAPAGGKAAEASAPNTTPQKNMDSDEDGSEIEVSIFPAEQSTMSVTTLACLIVFLWLLAILAVILVKIATDRCRKRQLLATECNGSVVREP